MRALIIPQAGRSGEQNIMPKKDPIDYFDQLAELDDEDSLDADENETDAELAELDLTIPDETEDITPGDGESVEDYVDDPMEEPEEVEDIEGTEEPEEPEVDTEDTEVDPEVKSLRKENAHRRVQLQELRDSVEKKAEAQAARMVADMISEVTGEKATTGDGIPTFEDMRNQLVGFVSSLELQSKQARQHLALEKAAADLGANVERLLDSVSFNEEINNIDVNATDYNTLVKRAMQNAVQVNPSFKEKDNAPRSGVDMTTGADTPLSGDGIAELAKRRRERRNRS